MFVTESARRELLEDFVGQTLVAHVVLLGRPDVEVDAVVVQDPALRFDHSRDGIAAEVLDPLVLGGAVQQAAALLAIALRQVDEVLAGIAVRGQRGRFAELLPHARLERAGERLELVTGVVDVELGRDARALRA